MQGEAARGNLQLDAFDIFRSNRLKFEHRAVAREVERFEVSGIVDTPPAGEFVEASQANDFVPVARRNDFSPHRIENVEVEFIQAAAHLAFLPMGAFARIQLFA
jgi:hypothetical protein